jgi:hypothetical protein
MQYPPVHSPHENSHRGGDCGVSPPFPPPPPAPPTHGVGRVDGNPSPPQHPPSPHPHHLVGRLVRAKFGPRWYRGVVTDHDVYTEAELMWHVKFDDRDECDLNLVELLPVLLPETHLFPSSVSQHQAPSIPSPSPSNLLSSVSTFHLPSPPLFNHLSPFVMIHFFHQTPTSPISPQSCLPNHIFPSSFLASSPHTPPTPNSPLPIASPHHPFPKFPNSPPIGSSFDSSFNSCPLSFSAFFSASPVPVSHHNPFQSLSLGPFPIDPTHNTLFTSPFALPFFPQTTNNITRHPRLSHLPPLSPTNGRMVGVWGGGGGVVRWGK